MNTELLINWIFILALVVYLSQLPERKLNVFGNFLKKVLGVLPISKVMDAILKTRKNR